MTKEELIQKLTLLGVHPNSYSLDENVIDGIMLEHSYNYYGDNKKYSEWRVFYQERGQRYDEQSFYNIEDAYSELYKRLEKSMRYFNKK